MKKSIVNVATAVWTIGSVLSLFILSVPPAKVPIFLGLAFVGLIPLALGSRLFKIIGFAAVTGSLTLAYLEYQSGLRHHTRMEHLRQNNTVATPPTNTPTELRE